MFFRTHIFLFVVCLFVVMRKSVLLQEFKEWVDTLDDGDIAGCSLTTAEGVSFSVQLFGRAQLDGVESKEINPQ